METLAPLPIPVQPGLPLVGNSLAFVRDPLAALDVLKRHQARIVQISLGGRNQFVLFQPEDAKHVLQENNKNYGRAPAFQVLRILLGNGLLTSEGDFWRRQRRLAQPAFHRQKLAILAQTMAQESIDWTARLRKQDLTQPVNLSASLMDVTMRIVCKTLFSSDVGDRLAGLSTALETANYLANDRIINPIRFPLHWPTPANRQFKKSGAVIDNLIYEIIGNRRSTGERRDDLLDMLLTAEDEETGERMSDQQLRDECVTLFAAGHETTAVSMAWTLHLLATHPDVAGRVCAEVSQLPTDPAGLVESLRALPYTYQVVQESLRLYPPAWIMSRLALNDDHFGPHTVPAGNTVLISPWLLHRDAAIWPNPDKFDPDRFAAERVKERHPYAYIPFGGGPRLCIGNQFALMEMQIMLAVLLRQFRLRPVPGQVAQTQPLITLRPKKPLSFYLEF